MFEHPYEKINKEDRDIHKYVSKIISQRTYFVFGLDPKEVDYNRGNTNYNCKKALFSNRLLRAALLKLVEFIKEYQIKELPEADKVANLIDGYNHRHKTRLPKSEMVGF